MSQWLLFLNGFSPHLVADGTLGRGLAIGPLNVRSAIVPTA